MKKHSIFLLLFFQIPHCERGFLDFYCSGGVSYIRFKTQARLAIKDISPGLDEFFCNYITFPQWIWIDVNLQEAVPAHCRQQVRRRRQPYATAKKMRAIPPAFGERLHMFAQAKAGARVAMCGTKLWPAWGVPMNWYLRATHRHYITNMQNFDRPWAKLAPRLARFGVEVQWPPGWRYLAIGCLPG